MTTYTSESRRWVVEEVRQGLADPDDETVVQPAQARALLAVIDEQSVAGEAAAREGFVLLMNEVAQREAVELERDAILALVLDQYGPSGTKGVLDRLDEGKAYVLKQRDDPFAAFAADAGSETPQRPGRPLLSRPIIHDAADPASVRDRCRSTARMFTHHALWHGLLPYGWDAATEKFGRLLAARIAKAIGETEAYPAGRPVDADELHLWIAREAFLAAGGDLADERRAQKVSRIQVAIAEGQNGTLAPQPLVIGRHVPVGDELIPLIFLRQSARIGEYPDRIIVELHSGDAIDLRDSLNEALPTPVLSEDGVEPLRFLYRNWRGETRERSAIPIGFRFGSTQWHPEPQWLMLARDTEKSAMREFAVRDMGAPDGGAQLGEMQRHVDAWMQACFGSEIAADLGERNHRFLEEALEFVQAHGCTASEAHQLVDYVFGRPVGEPDQEAGGVLVTFAAHCNAAGIDAAKAYTAEITRVWTKIDAIRAKQAAKPKHSPLPEAPNGGAADV